MDAGLFISYLSFIFFETAAYQSQGGCFEPMASRSGAASQLIFATSVQQLAVFCTVI